MTARRPLSASCAGLAWASVRSLAVAWGLVGLGALGLVLAYPEMPEQVVLYRLPWAEAPTTGPKSLLTVGRLAWMGVGQLGAATAMVFATRGSERWERFWRWLGLVAGAKTALECAVLLAPGLERAFTLATLGVVAAFLALSVRWWRRGELRDPPRVHGAPRVWLVAALAVWAAFALAPRFVG